MFKPPGSYSFLVLGMVMLIAKEVCGLSSKHAWQKDTWWQNETVEVTITENLSWFNAYNALQKSENCKFHRVSAFPEISKAKEDYLNAKSHAKHVVWQASKESFKATNSQGIKIFLIAKQMERKKPGHCI